VPLGGAAYENTDGSIKPAATTVFVTAGATYLAAMITAGLQPVVYSRPKKGTFTGGHTATIVGVTSGAQPAGLRSRRS
jgi:hypothetical protein